MDSKKIIPNFALPFENESDLEKNIIAMSRICQITGKKLMVGNNVSHSNIKTRRKFYPNLQTKKFFVPEEDAWIELKVSTSALRTINKNGIYACLKEARIKGFLK